MVNNNAILKKIEKGPLQRFKNSNLLMKKFGEIGLQVYRLITGKRTAGELCADLDMEEEAFWAIIDYMQEAGMVELVVGGKSITEESTQEPQEKITRAVSKKNEEPTDEVEEELRIEPQGDISSVEAAKEEKTKKKDREESDEHSESQTDLSIEPEGTKDEDAVQKESEDTKEIEEKEESPSEEESLKPQEDSFIPQEDESTQKEEASGLNTAERMIKERFGDVGLKVYTLIDGSRTTQEIMDETGVSDTKLVEILNFLEDRGIIKMEERERSSGVVEKPSKEETLGDVLAPDEGISGADPKGFPTIDIPVKLGIDIVKSLKIKADLILKFGDKGTKIFEAINGKNDILDIAITLQIPL